MQNFKAYTHSFTEMFALLSELIRNRCVNPPGNEMRSIKSIELYLSEQGIKSRVYEPAPGRGNLTARISGSGDGPILMLGPGHVDVVPVENVEVWDVDPFAAAVRDGYVWGRGSHDMLFMVTAHVQAFVDFHKIGVRQRGDLVLLVVSDEEDEGALGTQWMIEHHPEVMETDYAVSEAGGWLRRPGEVVFTYGEKGDVNISPVESVFVSLMEEAVQREIPSARLVPELMPGKTDLKYLRKLGVEAYGFGLYDPDTPLDARVVHGPNERVSLRTLELTHRVYYNLAKIFSQQSH